MLTAINHPLANRNISIRPNPTNGNTTILIEHTSNGTLQLYLQDLLGRSHYLGKETLVIGENFIVKDLSDFPKGMYILTSWVDRKYQQSILLEIQ